MLLNEKQRRNLMLLILLVTLSFKSFSQTDIVKDSTKIQLTKPIAKLVVKDLVSGDQLIKEFKVLESTLEATNLKLSTQSALVGNLNNQIVNYKSILLKKDDQFNTQNQLQADLEAALKKSKRQTTIYKIGAGVGAVATLLLLVQ
jgi:hypothetical protein